MIGCQSLSGDVSTFLNYLSYKLSIYMITNPICEKPTCDHKGTIEAGLSPVPGSEGDASMSFSTFDERTGTLYAIVEGGGPEEDVVSRWIPSPDLSSISREQGIRKCISKQSYVN